MQQTEFQGVVRPFGAAGKATALLGACAVGAVATTAWEGAGGGFCASLLSHGFLAATVGGLADWFAVTALFRKPLGISYRTDVLRRQRPRIMRELVDFVGMDLLSRVHIESMLQAQDVSAMLVTYLRERGGAARVHALAETLLRKVVEGADTAAMAHALAPQVRALLCRADSSSLVAAGADAIAESPCRQTIARLLLCPLHDVIRDASVMTLLLAHIRAVRETYIGDSSGRAMLFSFLDLSDEEIAEMILRKVDAWLTSVEAGAGEAWAALDGWLAARLRDASLRMAIYRYIERVKTEQLQEGEIEAWLSRALDAGIRGNLSSHLAQVRAAIDAQFARFATDDAWQAAFRAWVLRTANALLDEYHDEIPKMVEAYLARLSDDEIVTLAETRVADDLQMIRINGSVVGACVGMALFVLTTLAEGAFR